MDVVEIEKQKYVNTNLIVSSLVPQMKHFLLSAFQMKAAAMFNSNIILHTANDIFRQLRIKFENFALLLTDATRYMSSTGNILQELYLTLMHVTCIAHSTALCELALILKLLMT